MKISLETGSRPECKNPRDEIEAWRDRAATLRQKIATLPPGLLLAFDNALTAWESTFERDDALGSVLELLGEVIQETRAERGETYSVDNVAIKYLIEVRIGVQIGIVQKKQQIETDLIALEELAQRALDRTASQTQ